MKRSPDVVPGSPRPCRAHGAGPPKVDIRHRGRHKIDAGQREGVTTTDARRVKDLGRQVREVRERFGRMGRVWLGSLRRRLAMPRCATESG